MGSQRKRKREHRRKLRARNLHNPTGYVNRWIIVDEAADWLERNREAYVREAELSLSILRQDRHSISTGEWYGPSPEPRLAGVDCNCRGCIHLFYLGLEPLREGVLWRQANPIPGVVLSSRVERPQAPADPGD